MSKLIVSANKVDDINILLSKKIDGIILSIKDLSVNDSYYLTVDEVKKIDFLDKEVFVSLNKLMHNNDLVLLRKVMNELKDMKVKILFYDMAIYTIAKEYDMVDKLVICQDHLNASTLSNEFYYNLGIKTSYVTNDITYQELMNIKNNSKMKIMFLVYGYQPIFYSRRYLVKNYLDFIGEKKEDTSYKIISDMNKKYPIVEEKYGTTIYTEEPINLLNYLSDLDKIDYLVLKSNMIDSKEYFDMVDRFINKEKIEDEYIGFFNTKTIYQVK